MQRKENRNCEESLKKSIWEENYNFMNKPENVCGKIQRLMVKSMSMRGNKK